MNPVAIMLVVHATLTAASTDSYSHAYRSLNEEGRPMVVLVGADWCPACVTMKESVIPEAKRGGLFSAVNFAQVNLDHEPDLAKQVMTGGTIPQLVLFQKASDGSWRRDQLTGLQSISSVANLVGKVGAGPAPVMAGRVTVVDSAPLVIVE